MSAAIQCFARDSLDAAVQAHLNGTSPWTIISPGWAPEPDAGRGTMSIIWSCLATIFACSWTANHPNFPGKDSWYSSKVWLCVTAIVAPEMLAAFALEDYLRVRKLSKVIEKIKKSQWTMSQIFFVYMGGVEVEFEDCTETLGCNSNSDFDCSNALIIFLRAVKLKMLDFKAISSDDITKRSKTNYIVKALVCLQAWWLVAQVIGRAIAKLPITTLEVVTVGYVICALITYFCYWHKPQDAEVSILLNCKNLTKANFQQQINALEEDGPFVTRRWNIPIYCVITGAFGAVHCTAWNFFFSTVAESIVWKVASVLTVATPTIFSLYIFDNDTSSTWGARAISVLGFVYIPVRLYLMVEPFVAFRSVPIGIFYTLNWSSWIPHV